MSRASERTREALIEAAAIVFAEKGYEGGSVRDITRKAGANQAAITYHFGGKEGLYREVLRVAFAALKESDVLDAERLDVLEPREALRLFVRQMLLPLLKRTVLARYIRILNWEILQRTDIFQDLAMSENASLVTSAERLVRRFLGEEASAEEVAVASLWLLHQGFIFVRDYEYLTRPPHNLKVDESFVDRLADFLTRLLASGLAGATS
ncbi:TetR/AcrR family transcriptional regulator [Microvirga sp. HBU67558]|uniref:TetR/AcrR family transcriptional regulator n=1 Tax=Microvirga TaxID=186650 RepID=UPI001B38910F|nr:MULTISPECIES: CerR family C-terminal domain-containing protein [unclassified Microvirga]MBQ0822424.1 TetR/AcrR family transcriptional regulator [Microvirga sp. HBU67558]